MSDWGEFPCDGLTVAENEDFEPIIDNKVKDSWDAEEDDVKVVFISILLMIGIMGR